MVTASSRTSIGDTTLQPDGASNTVPAKAPVTINVKFANQGDNVAEERDRDREADGARPGRGHRQEDGQRDAARHRGGRRDPAAEGAAAGTAATLTVRVEPVGGEKNTDNNQATYTVLFSS